jgi:hypothetical protein
MDPTVRDSDVLSFVKREYVDLVTSRAEEFQHRPHSQRGPAGLKEGVRRKYENFHPTASGTS